MQKKCVLGGPVAMLAALAVLGCGSSSNHLTKSQYAERANAICQQARTATASARAALDKLPPPKPGSHASAAQLTQAAQAENTESSAMNTVATRLKALGAPATDANLASELSTDFVAIGADEAALGHEAASHNLHAAATAFLSLKGDTDHLGKAAKQLGVNICTRI